MPATLLTKSAAVQRDLDLWEEVHRRPGFLLMMSIMTLDERRRAIFEPGASGIEQRLQALAQPAARLSIGPWRSCPFFPGLSDSEEQLRAARGPAVEIGSGVCALRRIDPAAGRQKSLFFRRPEPDLSRSSAGLRSPLCGEPALGQPRCPPTPGRRTRAPRVFREARLPTTIPHRLYRDRLRALRRGRCPLAGRCCSSTRSPAAVERLRPRTDRYRAWLRSGRRSSIADESKPERAGGGAALPRGERDGLGAHPRQPQARRVRARGRRAAAGVRPATAGS